MPSHQETRVLPYTPEQMFDLVADVRDYPNFLPWVIALRIRRDDATDTLADMIVGFKGLRETFTSRVAKQRPDHIHVDYVDGPLKHLRNEWSFRPDPVGCAVDFSVDFAFKNRIFEKLAGKVFETALSRMIGAFEARAAERYGVSPEIGNSSSSAQSAA
ncbi:type II toxin-antitoxin system RatA family toxin [uncultured Sphingomonas sp.]|uniref:type II toxin-antitoxin system RatA family toxin n=1 Tax=uncultured Sphingomonas sp. TaxID=158754 RepID=UPI0035CAE7D3